MKDPCLLGNIGHSPIDCHNPLLQLHLEKIPECLQKLHLTDVSSGARCTLATH